MRLIIPTTEDHRKSDTMNSRTLSSAHTRAVSLYAIFNQWHINKKPTVQTWAGSRFYLAEWLSYERVFRTHVFSDLGIQKRKSLPRLREITDIKVNNPPRVDWAQSRRKLRPAASPTILRERRNYFFSVPPRACAF